MTADVERTPGSGRISVLIVDDDRLAGKALSLILGNDPTTFPLAPEQSGEDAVAAYRQHGPDVVLMDINMGPGMNGIEATRLIREFDPQAKVLVLTTIAPGPGIARALEAGAKAALQKSAPDSVITDTVKQISSEEDPRLLRNLAEDIIITGNDLPDPPIDVPHLTETEHNLLMLVCEGLSYDEIAEQSHVSRNTIKTHMMHLRRKLAADNLGQLIVRALQFRFYTY